MLMNYCMPAKRRCEIDCFMTWVFKDSLRYCFIFKIYIEIHMYVQHLTREFLDLVSSENHLALTALFLGLSPSFSVKRDNFYAHFTCRLLVLRA